MNSFNSGVIFFRLLFLALACFCCPAFLNRSEKFLDRVAFLASAREERVSSRLDELAIEESICRILGIPFVWEGGNN